MLKTFELSPIPQYSLEIYQNTHISDLNQSPLLGFDSCDPFVSVIKIALNKNHSSTKCISDLFI